MKLIQTKITMILSLMKMLRGGKMTICQNDYNNNSNSNHLKYLRYVYG